MDIKAINIAIQNANKITVALADRGLFAEAGVVHSLTQAVRVVHNAYNEVKAELEELRKHRADSFAPKPEDID